MKPPAAHLKAKCPVCAVELAFSWHTEDRGATIIVQLTDQGHQHIQNHYKER